VSDEEVADRIATLSELHETLGLPDPRPEWMR
jgi:hypothetical protein